MRKVFSILYLISIVLPLVAQIPPDWYDAKIRKMQYPNEAYYIGYVTGVCHSGETMDDALARLKNEARVELVASIQTTVEHSMQNTSSSDLRLSATDFNEDIHEVHITETYISSTIKDIPGLNVEAWHNQKDGEIAAFAYVKKNSLIRQLEKKITVELTKIETTLDQIGQLIDNGQKLQARELAENTLPQFEDIKEAQKLLVVVDNRADEESLQLQETRELQHKLTGIITELKNGINIFLSCNADLFGSNYSTLKGEIQGELSKLGTTFVGNATQSDWAVYVTAKAREYNRSDFGNMSSFFAYVDVQIIVEKTATGQRIYESAISEKGGHTQNYEQAARQAYREVSPKVSTIIKEQIQK